jgi:POT family proton-dependent oligopeptide transporter
MRTDHYRTAPDHNTTGWPKGIPYIMAQEAGERFLHYLQRSVLKPLLESVLLPSLLATIGVAALAGEQAKHQANEYYHQFLTATYLACVLGGVFADRFLGKYKAMLYTSPIYLLGGLLLVIGSMKMSLPVLGFALAITALTSGIIKASAQPHMGDQFGNSNWVLIAMASAMFYMAVNGGAFLSGFSGAIIRDHWGYPTVYTIAIVVLAVASFIFWLGRKKYAHISPTPGGKLGLLDSLSATAFMAAFSTTIFTLHFARWITVTGTTIFFLTGVVIFRYRQTIQKDHGFLATNIDLIKNWTVDLRNLWEKMSAKRTGRTPILRAPAVIIGIRTKIEIMVVWMLNSCFAFISMFWALFDQYGSSWQDQAALMNMNLSFGPWSFKLDKTQINTINPILILVLTPFIKKYAEKRQVPGFWQISIGLFGTAAAFAVSTYLQHVIIAAPRGSISVGWQFVQYFLITVSEILVSVTGLTIAYQLAPKSMKSTVSACFQCTVAVGNTIVAVMEGFLKLPTEKLLLLSTEAMFIVAAIFAFRVFFLYRSRLYQVWLQLQARERKWEMLRMTSATLLVPIVVAITKAKTGVESDPSISTHVSEEKQTAENGDYMLPEATKP